MNTRTLIVPILALAMASLVNGQSLDPSALIRKAQNANPSVKAAEASVAARQAELAASRSGNTTYLELAPGVGYTNGNALLSRELDFFGRGAARALVSQSELALAEIMLLRVRSEVASDMLDVLAEHLGNIEALSNAKATLTAARELEAAVVKQVEIGEAPQVHATRAQLDVLRANQAVVQADAKLGSSQSTIDSLLGEPFVGTLDVASWQSVLPASESAPAASFNVLMAKANVSLAESRITVLRANNRPVLSAGIASDIWSLDRDARRGENLGFQLSLRIPLFDHGQSRNTIRAGDADLDRAKAEVLHESRLATLALEKALRDLHSARAVAEAYAGDIVPRGEQMLVAMREGYRTGLVTLVEVLEAQQALVRLRQEKTLADYAYRQAQIAVMAATLTLPETAVTR